MPPRVWDVDFMTKTERQTSGKACLWLVASACYDAIFTLMSRHMHSPSSLCQLPKHKYYIYIYNRFHLHERSMIKIKAIRELDTSKTTNTHLQLSKEDDSQMHT